MFPALTKTAKSDSFFQKQIANTLTEGSLASNSILYLGVAFFIWQTLVQFNVHFVLYLQDLIYEFFMSRKLDSRIFKIEQFKRRTVCVLVCCRLYLILFYFIKIIKLTVNRLCGMVNKSVNVSSTFPLMLEQIVLRFLLC